MFFSPFTNAQAAGCIGATENFTCGDSVTESCTLNADLSSSGTCFTVNTNDVVIDCQGHWVNGTDTWSSIGVHVNRSHNITVRHCRFSDWFEGIYVDRADNGTFENNTVLSSTYYGIRLNRARGNTLSSNALNTTGGRNLAFQANSAEDYNNSIDASNTVLGVPISFHFRNCTGFVVGDQALTHLTLADCQDVTVRNVSIANADGISLAYVNDSVIADNTLTGNYVNLYLGYSRNLTLTGNALVNSSKQYGLRLQSVDDSAITDNVIRHNSMHGIYARSSDNVTLTNNTVCDNGGESSSYYDISQGSSDTLEGTGNLCTTTENYNDTGTVNCTHACLGCVGAIDIYRCGETVTESCTLNGNVSTNLTCYTAGADGVTIDCQGHSIIDTGGTSTHGVFVGDKDDVTVRNCDIHGFQRGIYLSCMFDICTGCLMQNNTLTNTSERGMFFEFAQNTTVTGNRVVDAGGDAIVFIFSSQSHVLGNTITGGDEGIYLTAADQGILAENTITDCGGEGIWVNGENYSIWENTITSAGENGIRLQSGDDHVIEDNTVQNSTENGIYLQGSVGVGTLSDNVFCASGVIDVNDTGTGSTGTGNTCDSTIGYNDTAYDGCATTCDGSTGLFTGGCVGATETFVCGDTVNESCTLNADLSANGTCLTLGADNLTVDGAGHILTGNGTSWGVYAVNRGNIVIRNLNITDFYTGIHLLGGDNITLLNNIASNNSYYGLYLRDVTRSRVIGNTANENNYGIFLQSLTQNAVNNSFVNNTANDNLYRGLSLTNNTNAPNLYNSTGNTVTGNAFCNNNPAGSPTHADLWDDDSNTGDNNTCDTATNWNDDGTTGCTNSCGCNCNSCVECAEKLNGTECSTVSLIRDVNHTNASRCLTNLPGFQDETFDCLGHTIAGPGASQHGIYLSESNGTTIRNCILENWNAAYYLTNSQDNVLDNNTARDCSRGFELYNNMGSTIRDNTARFIGGRCFYFNNGPNTNNSFTITGNTALNCSSIGFQFWRSYNNTVSGNTADNCTDEGFHLFASGDNTLTGNNATLNDKGIYLRSDANGNTLANNVVIENDLYGIHLVDSDENALAENNAWGNDEGGIVLVDSHNNSLTGDVANQNTGGNDHGGFMLDASHDNTLSAVTGSGNSVEGLYLNYSARTVIADSTFQNNTGGGIGIIASPNTALRNCTVTDGYNVLLRASDNTTFANNTFANNSHYGLTLYSSNHTRIEGNTVTGNGEVGIFVWGSTNVTVSGNTVTDNGIVGVDLSLNSFGNTVTGNTIAQTGCGSTFHISQEIGSGLWAERYSQSYETAYTTKFFAFTTLADRLKLRITQRDVPFAGIEAAELSACGNPVTPDYAIDADTGESVLEDILAADLNVTDAHDRLIEIAWQMPAGCDSAVLALIANEYGTGTPHRFPPRDYEPLARKDAQRTLTVDGILDEVDGVVEPDYAPLWKPTSGHPWGTTYIYASEDEDNLYLSLDLTADNTDDADEDWAELTLRGAGDTTATYRIDDANDAFGRCSFGMTSKAAYKHQSCEFAIPKAELPPGDLSFALRYYGTSFSTITGIWSDTADNNTITDNTVNSNCGYGIYLGASANANNVTGNTFCQNTLADIRDDDSNLGDQNACTNATGWTDSSASSGCVNPCTSTQNTTFYTGWNLMSLWLTP